MSEFAIAALLSNEILNNRELFKKGLRKPSIIVKIEILSFLGGFLEQAKKKI